MKTQKIIISIAFLLVSTFTMAQKEVKTINIHVDGVCGMCEERIENALDTKGIKYANWDRQTHECEITYRADILTEEEIHQLLNEAGHDTDKSKASDEAYSDIHACCKYREDHDH